MVIFSVFRESKSASHIFSRYLGGLPTTYQLTSDINNISHKKFLLTQLDLFSYKTVYHIFLVILKLLVPTSKSKNTLKCSQEKIVYVVLHYVLL